LSVLERAWGERRKRVLYMFTGGFFCTVKTKKYFFFVWLHKNNPSRNNTLVEKKLATHGSEKPLEKKIIL